MQSFSYVNVGDGLPLAPIISIKVTAPEWLDKSGEYAIEAFLDTGSDCTLIPLEIISSLELSIVDSYVEITGVAGGRVDGYACYANIWLGEKCIRAVRVYGCTSKSLENRVLIGRDVLNQCCIEFDGVNSRLTIGD
jgi:Retroviral aspartyl protease